MSDDQHENIQAIIEENDDLDIDDENMNIDDILAEIDDYDDDTHHDEKDIKINNTIDNELNESKTSIQQPIQKDNQKDNKYNLQEINPLELIDKQERQFSYSIEEQKELEPKFPFKNFKASSSQYNNINYIKHDTINNLLYPSNKDLGNDLGTPKCISILPGKYIAIGTSRSITIIFEYIQNIISPMRKLSTAREIEYGSVTAMDISTKDDCLICGYEGGQLVLWDLRNGANIKTIQGFHTTPVLSVKFWKDTKSHIISSDIAGNVYLFAINKVLLSFTVDKQILLERAANSILSITPLRKEFTRNTITTLVALASMELILVVTLEPVVGIVYRFERPQYIREGMIPSISWGTGPIPEEEENKETLLMIAWGYAVYLIQIKASENDDNTKIFTNVGIYNSDLEIIYASWISKGFIFIVDAKKNFKILSSNEFETKLDPKTHNPNESPITSAAILNSQSMDSDLPCQTYLKDISNKARALYSNIISASDISNRVFILGSKSIYEGELVNWEKFVKSLTHEGRWVDALSLALDLYKGNLKIFCNMPVNKQEKKAKLKPFCYDIIRRYIVQIGNTKYLNKIEEKQVWEQARLTAIDFLVLTENFDYLFNEMFKIMDHFSQKESFIASLEPFILCNRIKYVSNDTLREIIYYFKDCNKYQVLQYLIINIDLEKIDVGFLITLCIENQLYTPLIYISTRSDPPDFMTPLVKIFSEYKHRLENNMPTAQEMGLKCLWFINMTLKQKIFPDEILDYELWRKKIIEIIIWAFHQSIMPLIIKIHPYLVFEMLSMIFDKTISDIIQEDRLSIMIYTTKSLSDSHNEILFELVNIEENKAIFYDMISLIYESAIKSEEAKIELYYFIGKMAAWHTFNFKDKIIKDIIIFILKNTRKLPKWADLSEIQSSKIMNSKNTMELLGDDENANNNDLGNNSKNDEQKEDIRTDILLILLRRFGGKFSKLDINDIKQILKDNHELIEVKCVLKEIEGDYKQCFDFFLDDDKSSTQKKKVFRWLEYIFDYLRKQDNKAQIKLLKETILQNIDKLIVLDTLKARKIISSQDKEFETEAIKKLNKNPKQQLDYLAEVMLQAKKGEPIDDKLFRLYITLLCKFEPKNVLKELKSYDFDLDFCINICKEYNNKEGLAYAFDKAGLAMESLNLHLEIFAKLVTDKIKKIEKNGKFKFSKLLQKMDEIKELCKKYNKVGDPDSEGLWFIVLDKILEIHKYYISNKKEINFYKDLVNTYSDIISSLFDDLMTYVALESLAQKLKRGFMVGSIKLGDLRPSLLNLFANYHYESNILKDSRSLMINDVVNDMLRFYAELSRGDKGERLELDPDIIDKIIVFKCNHVIPKSYTLGSNTCNLCNKNDATKLSNLIWSLRKGYISSDGKSKLRGANSIKEENKDLEKQYDDKRGLNALIDDDLTKSNTNELNLIPPTPSKGYQKEKYLRQMLIFDKNKIQEFHMLEEFRAVYDDDSQNPIGIFYISLDTYLF